MAYAASCNRMQEGKIKKYFAQGMTAEEIAGVMAIEKSHIELYNPETKGREQEKRKPGRPPKEPEG